MKNNKLIKSGLGVLILIASLTLGGFLIFKEPEKAKPKVESKNPPSRQTDLTVKIKATGPQGMALVIKTKCPSSNARCSSLQGLQPEDLRLKPDTVCSQQYGGPSIAEVNGLLNGKPVSTTLSVRDGCQIALWNRLSEPLGLPRSDGEIKTID